MEIKESYKERLSESTDNSLLIVMIRANWMTLDFSNAAAFTMSPHARIQRSHVSSSVHVTDTTRVLDICVVANACVSM